MVPSQWDNVHAQNLWPFTETKLVINVWSCKQPEISHVLQPHVRLAHSFPPVALRSGALTRVR